MSWSHGTVLAVCSELSGLANVARCANGAASASLERALGRSRLQVPPELSPHEPLSALRSRFTGSSKVCSIDALRTVGVPDEILDLACTEVDPVMAGGPDCGCGGLCDVDAVLMEDPDNRPYIWDQEEECR